MDRIITNIFQMMDEDNESNKKINALELSMKLFYLTHEEELSRIAGKVNEIMCEEDYLFNLVSISSLIQLTIMDVVNEKCESEGLEAEDKLNDVHDFFTERLDCKLRDLL